MMFLGMLRLEGIGHTRNDHQVSTEVTFCMAYLKNGNSEEKKSLVTDVKFRRDEKQAVFLNERYGG
jgi:hypothetical protein